LALEGTEDAVLLFPQGAVHAVVDADGARADWIEAGQCATRGRDNAAALGRFRFVGWFCEQARGFAAYLWSLRPAAAARRQKGSGSGRAAGANKGPPPRRPHCPDVRPVVAVVHHAPQYELLSECRDYRLLSRL